MNPDYDVDLKQWTADWQAAPDHVDSPEQIRRYVTRRTRLLWSFAISDVIVGAIMLPVLIYLSVSMPRETERMAMLALVSITISALVFGWWNRRGVLRSSATTIADHVVLSSERLRRMRTAWRVGWIVLAAEVIVFTSWIWDRTHSATRAVAPGEVQFAWSWLSAFTLLAIFGLVKFSQWLTRDETRFEALKRELDRD